MCHVGIQCCSTPGTASSGCTTNLAPARRPGRARASGARMKARPGARLSIYPPGSWAAWIERSTDGGKTWAKIGPIVPPVDPVRQGTPDAHAGQVPGSSDWKDIDGIIQPSVVPLGRKHLRLYARSTAKTGR